MSGEKQARELSDDGEVRAKQRSLMLQVLAEEWAGKKKNTRFWLGVHLNVKRLKCMLDLGHAGGNRPARNLD
jgi:hypothetical protein